MSKSIVCALCLYVEAGGEAKPALTVLEGYAVCEDHLGYVAQGERWYGIFRSLKREAALAPGTPVDVE